MASHLEECRESILDETMMPPHSQDVVVQHVNSVEEAWGARERGPMGALRVMKVPLLSSSQKKKTHKNKKDRGVCLMIM